MPGPSPRALEHVVGRSKDPIERPEQERRVQIALDAASRSDARPGVVEVDAPVGADHVAAGGAHLAENRTRPDAEVYRRHARRCEAIENAPGVWINELAVVGGVQGAHPGIEYLNGVHAGFDLGDQILGRDVSNHVAEAVPCLWRAV